MSDQEHDVDMPQGERARFLDKQENVDRLLWGATVVGILILLVDFFFHRHSYHPWERLWGFYGIYGFIGVSLLVLAAKQLRKVVKRPEDYYDAD